MSKLDKKTIHELALAYVTHRVVSNVVTVENIRDFHRNYLKAVEVITYLNTQDIKVLRESEEKHLKKQPGEKVIRR
jgi:hypothetical protein